MLKVRTRPSRPSAIASGVRRVVAAAAESKVQASRARPAAGSPSDAAAKVLGAVETLSLGLALSTHAYTAARRQQLQGRGEASVSVQQPLAPPPLPAPATLWLSLPLLLAVLCRRLLALTTKQPSTVRLSDAAAARMLRVEGLASSHQATLDTLTRQMEKVQVRARLVGRDLRSPLRQLETGAAAQGEVLASLAVRLEAMEGELKDTETLVAALQGVSAKQFDLLTRLMKQQQQQQQGPRQVQAKAAAAPQRQQAGKQAEAKAETKAKPSAAVAAAQVQQQQQPAAAGASRQTAGLDEWGRKVAAPEQAAPKEEAAAAAPPASSAPAVAAAAQGAAPASPAVQAAQPATPEHGAGERVVIMKEGPEGTVAFSFK